MHRKMTNLLDCFLKNTNHDELLDHSNPVPREESPPPPYSFFDDQEQSLDSNWKDQIVEIKPSIKFGLVLSGGIDTSSSSIVIIHISPCCHSSPDNGRSNLRLFDRVLSINDIALTQMTHDEVIRIFNSYENQSIRLHIRRLDPVSIESIDLIIPLGPSNQSLGFVMTGGLDESRDDPGLFIKYIDPKGLLASSIENDQVRIGDRLLEIKTNCTSADLRLTTRTLASELIRRTCQDDKRITLVVAHRPSNE